MKKFIVPFMIAIFAVLFTFVGCSDKVPAPTAGGVDTVIIYGTQVDTLIMHDTIIFYDSIICIQVDTVIDSVWSDTVWVPIVIVVWDTTFLVEYRVDTVCVPAIAEKYNIPWEIDTDTYEAIVSFTNDSGWYTFNFNRVLHLANPWNLCGLEFSIQFLNDEGLVYKEVFFSEWGDPDETFGYSDYFPENMKVRMKVGAPHSAKLAEKCKLFSGQWFWLVEGRLE